MNLCLRKLLVLLVYICALQLGMTGVYMHIDSATDLGCTSYAAIVSKCCSIYKQLVQK